MGLSLVSLKSCAATDIGRRRTNNEDSYFHDDDLGFFVVADGMGGHKGGDRASKLAVNTASSIFRAQVLKHEAFDTALTEGFLAAAKEVHEKSLSDPALRGMGTTLSALAIKSDRAFIGHIGDSRVYCFRDGELHQLTSDHSLVNEHVQAGIMSQEEARISSLRNIITRAIGNNENVNADYFPIAVNINDIFLLCTDGLNSMLTDKEISDILARHKPELAIKQLILDANLRGGEDNITAILIEVRSL